MKKFSLFLMLLFALKSFSQKEANIWYFGENAGLDFNTNPPIGITDGKINTFEGCSSFSDANGDLLFYSDGITVWDKNHDIMKYTDGSLANNLKGDPSSTQSGMIIPKPGSSSIYYLFTVDDGPEYNNFGVIVEDGKGLNAYTIDLSDGNGKITAGPIALSDGKFNDWTEKVAAVKGADCNTYWVVSVVDNQFYSFLIDDTGINTTAVISSVDNDSERRGYLKLSPDGTKLATANQRFDFRNNATVYNFDNATGTVSANGTKVITDTSNGQAYGVEFSADSKKLYISTVSGYRNTLDNSPVNYQLFQFDLMAADIPGSKALIHEQIGGSVDYPEGGYRGALQLGPDGRIYATIPFSYYNGFALFLDVIENPTAPATDVIFTKNAVDLKGKFATQGLPPFIASLLLPVTISDDITELPINNKNLKTCVGENRTITPEAITDITNDTYIWTFDNGIAVTEISNSATETNLNLKNIQPNNEGKYLLKITGTGACGGPIEYNASFNLKVFEVAKAKNFPEPIYFCDSDATAPNNFDLSKLSQKSLEILDGLDTTIFDVLYFDTFTKATENVIGSNLPNLYEVNEPSSQTIYARVHNKKAPDACFDITNFTLTVTGLPVAKNPGPYRECDTDTSGPDLGYHDTFLLETKDNDILGSTSGLDPTLYNVSYHTTSSGAQQDNATDVIPKNVPYRNTIKNAQPIYVRLENKADTNCFDASMSFNLVVAPLPIPNENPTKLKQCDTDSDKQTTFNLTLVESNISNNLKDRFEYYKTELDAIAGTPQVVDKTSYFVDTTGEAWVRIISEFDCYTISKIDLTVSYTPNEPYEETFKSCDDFFDADGNSSDMNDDSDGITFFDLSTTPNKISSDPDIIVELYETVQDRTQSINEIQENQDLSQYRNKNIPNTTGNKFPIFYRLTSKTNNDCEGIGQFYLQVKSVPKAYPAANFDLCDDDLSGNTTDGINSGINLRKRVTDILGTTQTLADYDVTFHTSLIDANDLNSLGIPNDTYFSNTPQAGFTTGDISEQTIFVRVQDKNPNAQCISSPTSFKIIINPIPSISTTITPFPVCDVVTLSDPDPRNRIAQNIDLTSKNNEILAGKTNHRVAYYLTPQDAENNIQINNTTDFQNITELTTFPTTTDFNSDNPATQTIFVKVFDLGGNKCTSVFSTFELVIYPEPNIPLNISDYSDCDNMTDIDADDANGIIGNITLKNKIPEILANYNPAEFADFFVSFYTSSTDAEIGNPTNAINENTFENNSNGQPIFVRVENIKNTPIICVNTRLSFNININPLPDFTVIGEENMEDPQIVCLNNTPLTLEAENPLATYTYQWTNEVGDVLGNDATLKVIAAGKYTVTASDVSPIGCARERTIVVEESNIATLEQSFITIIDEANNIGSEDTISVRIDTTNNNLGPGDYQFAITNNDINERYPFSGYQEDPFFENLEGGIYTITANDKKGCSPDTQLQISVIQFPKFFTPNGDGKNDTWKIKGANKIFYPNSSMNIFNRFGTLVAQIPIDSQEWDGTYNGKTLSSDDYWFSVQLIPADTNKPPILKKGHFSLLR